MKVLIGWTVLALSTTLVGAITVMASVLGMPTETAILKVNGSIAHTNVGNEAHFDLGMLRALPQHSFETNTPWTVKRSQYRGPLMRTLLEHLGAEGDSVHVVALDGYEAQIPITDFYEYDVALVFERDGSPIPIREYGPLWVLYPFDEEEALLSEKMRIRAVWQVMEIDVR